MFDGINVELHLVKRNAIVKRGISYLLNVGGDCYRFERFAAVEKSSVQFFELTV